MDNVKQSVKPKTNPFELDIRVSAQKTVAHKDMQPASPPTCQTCRESQCSWSVITTCWSCSAC